MIEHTQLEDVVRFLNTDRFKYQVYLFLNRPRTCLAISYQIAVGVLLLTDMTLTIFMSRRDQAFSYKVIFWFDLAVCIIFGLELVISVWSATSLPKYRGWTGFIFVLINPMYVLDMVVWATCVAVLVFDRRETMLAVGLRGFRMLHFFENRYHLWRIVGYVMWTQRFQLAMVVYFCIVWLFIIGLLMFFIEAPYNDQFSTVANSLWFTLVTCTTVGYGDVAPISTPGKIVTSIGMLIGVSLFAMPGGVIGAGLALKVEDEETAQMDLRLELAATMVQYAWRVYWIKRRLQRHKAKTPNRMLIRLNSTRSPFRFMEQRDTGSIYGSEYGGPTYPNPFQNNQAYVSSQPNVNIDNTNPMFFNPYVVQFVYLLRYLIAKKRFKFSMYLCDSNTFYETYTKNTFHYNSTIQNFQLNLNNIEEMVNNTSQMVESLYQTQMEQQHAQRMQQEQEQHRNRRRRPRQGLWTLAQRRRLRQLRRGGRRLDRQRSEQDQSNENES